eukprot:TRINITY_DN15287_c0_g1_i1.p1 TRINITY_DN15287_c0_g1~~TRINITY_DN15287_c0_g1_i1.p1  ORF type:complete len:129 (-),score=26.22 TRINITY_DN15287_c0_g1_i1:461-847(-)
MKGWAKDQGTENTMLRLVGDTRAELTGHLGVGLYHPGPKAVLGPPPGGPPRCQRCSFLVVNGIIQKINIAASPDDPAGDNNPEVTCVEKMLEDLGVPPDFVAEGVPVKEGDAESPPAPDGGCTGCSVQ